MRYAPALLLARFLRWGIRRVRTGGGSALPGLLLARLAPGILYRTLGSFAQGLIVITGSAGKSTTTKMLVGILRAHGLSVFTNPSTANILQGFYSTIVAEASLNGRVQGQIAVLEMDEGHAAELVAKVKPRQSVILNVVEDQLDRFVDPAFVAEKLQRVAAATTERVHLNADDQNLVAFDLGNRPATSWFGLVDVIGSAGRGLGYAPTYREAIQRPHPAVEVTALEGKHAKLKTPLGDIDFDLPSRGAHFAVDAAAAVSLSLSLLERPDLKIIAKSMNEIPPVFARGEVVQIDGQSVELVLVQNPASMQLNLDALDPKLDCIYFGIGRDVHDPSWLWTVELPKLNPIVITAGYNANEAALYLEYNGVSAGEIIPDDIPLSVTKFLELPGPRHGVKTMVISADVMRRVRRHLGYETPEAARR